MNLYKITTDIQLRLDAILEGDIELTKEEQDELFGRIKSEAKEKQLAVAAYIKNLEIECNNIDDYISSITDRYNAKFNKISKLKIYLKESLERLEIDKVEGIEFDISIKKNPPCVLVEDESLLPMLYFNEKIVKSIDKKFLLDKLKSGEEIKGAKLQQNTRLEIK